MAKALVYIHGKGGNAEEAEHYKGLISGYTVIGFDYKSQTPWEASIEFSLYFDHLKTKFDSIVIMANSIGAFFVMNASSDVKFEKAFFVSPIVNMEKLITDMMQRAGVDERELKKRGRIETSFGETLSMEYLTWVRNHPVSWTIPTSILYGGNDKLQSPDTIRSFAEKTKADLTVMENGEHWFHTEEQMAFLDQWLCGHDIIL